MRYLKDEELQIATRYLFLSMAIVVIKQDISLVKEGSFKIKEPYIALLEKMVNEAVKERRKLRRIMAEQHIQVIRLNKNDSFTSFLFQCQGRQQKQNFFNPSIRKKVEAIIHELLVKALPPSQPFAAVNI
ncbi:hypothetical protein CUC15_07360 [Oceanobacillus zhaokaii]|jgi:hypothetical protein|uniref:Uncharacterized protein n=1 Tax=Oceanobacillus zhaokaii TaxID=2052660 RepID=A0A345PFG2_9BACI|nr:hypothetical protein [Oceanobacillus zhaokaii]AXI08742.1 hypothetical protein CUC15_07360 [Oceanobacillus zhaokaii]